MHVLMYNAGRQRPKSRVHQSIAENSYSVYDASILNDVPPCAILYSFRELDTYRSSNIAAGQNRRLHDKCLHR